MRTIVLLVAGIFVAAMTGCGNQTLSFSKLDVPKDAFTCTYETDCVVTVSVTDTTPCVVTVDLPNIEMKGSYTWTGVKHLIRWQLSDESAAAKYRFDPNIGVKLKNNIQSDQFSGQAPKGNGKQFHWLNKNSNYEIYEYEVNIVQKDSTKTCKKDPKIYNN